MKVYRKVIPRIAKDVIRVLLANRCIEIEEGRRDEAELDIAGVFVRVADDGRASKQKLEQLDRLLRSIGIIRAQYTHHQSHRQERL